MRFGNLNVFSRSAIFTSFSNFSCSATEILASLIALAAASFLKLRYNLIRLDVSNVDVDLLNQSYAIQNPRFRNIIQEFISIRVDFFDCHRGNNQLSKNIFASS
jgi:hypothetical protein